MDIIASNLKKVFTLRHGPEVNVLKGIDVTIKSGETVAVVGPSGAGKSTLLHILGLMDKPTSGTLSLGGTDFTKAGEAARTAARKERIGFLFQLHYLLPEFSVLENILLPVWSKKREIEPAARALIESLGLTHRASHLPSELSGGEQQRAALARALISGPRVLLCDEPTGNLDRETGRTVENLIFEECAKRNMTLLLVTHNPDLAAKASRIISMKDGLIN